jgi:predicted phage terminase large subunit-like protein
LTGYVLTQNGWTHLSLPAIAQESETHTISTPFGSFRHHRRAGEALHPEREPLEVLDGLRRSMGSAFFSAQYLQSPTPPGGGVVHLDWFPRFELENPPDFDRYVQSWDTAVSAKELSSFSVCTTWGIRAKKAYLIHVFRRRMEFPELRRMIVSQARAFHASIVLIEEAVSGASVLQDLRRELSTVRGCKPCGDKIMRMRAQTAHIENGFVYLPKAAPWLPDLEHELAMFPKGRYADQVDSIAQALEFIFTQTSVHPVLEYYEQLLKKQKLGDDREPRNVRVVSSFPCGLKVNSGRHVSADADGIFWLTEREAEGVRCMPNITILPRDED